MIINRRTVHHFSSRCMSHRTLPASILVLSPLKTVGLLLGSIAVAIVITGCGPAEPKENESEQQASSAAAQKQTKPADAKDAVVPVPEKSNSATTTYVSKDYGFTLQYPSGWYVLVDNRSSIFFSDTPLSDTKNTDNSLKRSVITLKTYKNEEYRSKSIDEIMKQQLGELYYNNTDPQSVINSINIQNFDVIEIQDPTYNQGKLLAASFVFALKHEDLLFNFTFEEDPTPEQEIAIIKQMIASLRF